MDYLTIFYLLSGVFLVYSLYRTMHSLRELSHSFSEPLLRKHFWWHSFAVLAIAVFYEVPIAGFLFGIPPTAYVLVRQLVFSFFVVSSFLSIKPLFDLSHTYSFSKNKPIVTEMVLFFILMTIVMLSLSSLALPAFLIHLLALGTAILVLAGAVLYFYASKRISSTFNEPNLRDYVSSHGWLMLLVLFLSQLEVLLYNASQTTGMFSQIVGIVGLLAVMGALELDKSLAMHYINAFSADYSFDDNAPAPTRNHSKKAARKRKRH